MGRAIESSKFLEVMDLKLILDPGKYFGPSLCRIVSLGCGTEITYCFTVKIGVNCATFKTPTVNGYYYQKKTENISTHQQFYSFMV